MLYTDHLWILELSPLYKKNTELKLICPGHVASKLMRTETGLSDSGVTCFNAQAIISLKDIIIKHSLMYLTTES